MSVGAFFAAILLAAGAALVWLGTTSGRDAVLAAALRAAQASGLQVTLTDVDGGLLDRMSIGEIAIADGSGRWLAAKQVRLAWRPSRLLTAKLHIVELAADEMTLSRLPQMAAPDPDDSAGGFGAPPIAVALDRLHIGRLDIDESVIGLSARLGLTAGAAFERGAASMTADVQRFDARGSIVAAAAYDVAQDRLTLDLRAEEPGGGLVARILALPGAPALRMTASGEGPLSAWRGRFEAALDGREWIALDGAVDRANDGKDGANVATIAGRVATAPLAGLLPDPAMAALGDTVAIDARALFAPRRAQLQELRLAGAAATLTASGEHRAADGAWRAAADLAMTPAALAGFGVTAHGAEAHLEAKGVGIGWDGSLSLRADRLSASGAIAEEATAHAVFAGRSGVIDATLRLDGRIAELPGGEGLPALIGNFAIDAHAKLRGGTVEIENATASLGPLTLTASGRYGDAAVRSAFALQLSDAAALSSGLAAGSLGDARLTGDLRYDDGEGLRVESMALDTTLGRMDGHLRLSPDFAALDAALGGGDLKLADAARAFGLPLSGGLRLNIAVTGATADPQARVEADLRQGRFDGQALPSLALRGDAASLASAPQGQASVTARPPQGAITLRSRFAVANERLTLRDLRLAGPGVSGQGDVALPLGEGAAEGRIALRAGDLGPLFAIAGLAGGGALEATATLGRSGAEQTLRATIDGREIALRQDGEALFDVARVRGNVALGRGQAFDVDLSAESVTAGGAALDSVTLAAQGKLSSLNYDLSLRAAAYGDLSLALAGELAMADDGARITVARGGGEVIGKGFAIQPGAAARIAPDDLRLSGLRIAGDGLGALNADFAAVKGKLDGEASLRGLDLASLEALTPGGLRGELDFALRLAGTEARPLGEATLTIAGLRLAEASDAPPADLDGRVTLDDSAAAAHVRMTGVGGEPLRLDGRLGRLPSGLGFADESPLAAQFAWRGDVAVIAGFLSLVGQHVAGDVTADLSATGTLGAPVARGSLALADGLIEDYDTGLSLRFDRVELAGEGRDIELRPFTARDAQGGTIAGEGRITLEGAFPFAARLDLARANLLERDDVKAGISGRLSAEGTMRDARISGALTSDSVEIDIGVGLPPEVTTVEVIEIGGDRPSLVADSRRGAENDAQPPSRGAGTTVALDVTLDLPGQVFVRGRGLDSEWSGRIAVAGTAAAPRVTGQLQSRRGTFDIVGKLFRLQSGTVELAPAASGDTDISLNVSALHQASSFQAIVTVSGSPASPSLALSSVPAYPQDEILSRLLFNKSRGALSALEALQLAQGLRSLTGGGGPDPIAALRRATGVDVLRVDAGEASQGPSLEAGKYLSDDIYVGVRQGATPGSSAVGVELDLTDRLKLRNETRQDGGSSVGLKYQFDY
ncbi:MAG: translocation/assembly module TamB domain-containing protein [Alphaproteobacteria bacterium]